MPGRVAERGACGSGRHSLDIDIVLHTKGNAEQRKIFARPHARHELPACFERLLPRAEIDPAIAVALGLDPVIRRFDRLQRRGRIPGNGFVICPGARDRLAHRISPSLTDRREIAGALRGQQAIKCFAQNGRPYQDISGSKKKGAVPKHDALVFNLRTISWSAGSPTIPSRCPDGGQRSRSRWPRPAARCRRQPYRCCGLASCR